MTAPGLQRRLLRIPLHTAWRTRSFSSASWPVPTPTPPVDAALASSSRSWQDLSEEKRAVRQMEGRGFHARGPKYSDGGNDYLPESPEQGWALREVAQLGRQRRWQEALEVFVQVRKPGLKLRTAMMDACARALQLDMAKRIFDEMPVKRGPAYSVMFTALGRARRAHDIRPLVDEMRANGVEFSAVTWGCLLNAYSNAKDVAAMFRVLDEMRASGLQPRHLEYGIVMAACARVGDRERVASLLKEMEAASIRPDLGHLTSLVVSCSRGKEEAQAREALAEIRRRGLRPDVVAYTGLMGCLSGPEALVKAEAIVAEMEAAGVPLDAFAHNAVARAALEAGQPARCRELLAEGLRKGFPRMQETSFIEYKLQVFEQVQPGKGAGTAPAAPPPLPPG